MEPTDRLAAYLAGELTTDEQRLLEAELARDSDLRGTLDAMRRADDALPQIEPVVPPDGFEDRTFAIIDAELSRILSSSPSRSEAATPDSDTIRRRATTRVPIDTPIIRPSRFRTWAPAFAGMAAGIAALAGIGLALINLPPSDDLVVMAGDIESHVDSQADPHADDARALTESLSAPEIASLSDGHFGGPLLVAIDRTVDDSDVIDLLTRVELMDVAARAQFTTDAATTAERWRQVVLDEVGGDVHALDSPTESAPPTAGDGARSPSSAPDAETVEPGPLRITSATTAAFAPDDLATIERCVSALGDESEPAIPAYVELATDVAGRPVLVMGLVLLDVEQDPLSGMTPVRREIRVLERDNCGLLAAFSA